MTKTKQVVDDKGHRKYQTWGYSHEACSGNCGLVLILPVEIWWEAGMFTLKSLGPPFCYEEDCTNFDKKATRKYIHAQADDDEVRFFFGGGDDSLIEILADLVVEQAGKQTNAVPGNKLTESIEKLIGRLEQLTNKLGDISDDPFEFSEYSDAKVLPALKRLFTHAPKPRKP